MKYFAAVAAACLLFAACSTTGSSDTAKSGTRPAASAARGLPYKGTSGTFGEGDRMTRFITTAFGDPGYISILMTVREKGKTTEADVTIARKNGVSYIDMSTGEGRIAVLDNGGEMTTIIHDERAYMKGDMVKFEPPFDEKEEDISSAPVKSGTEVIGGKTYDYEEVTDAEGTLRLYFDPGTDRCRYIGTDSGLITVTEYGSGVPDSWFAVPPGYTDMMAGMGGVQP